ncbi:flavodoxin domain-containing protein [Vagococcus elongatus]|uniref:Flavodoxin domain-containing protein n=1 Tax=Vagococcus elongatus TaxID=180344 RepID=A0A430ANN8_9ENTE|nr:flavodoxin domain-containing protein [Vagococcus elongatus]RSU09676.1 hypothetical protein CBF29_10885 [Vagococcus elongatus]
MKSLIIYSSKYGFTEECVTYLADNFKHDVTVVNINTTSKIDYDEFNWVIIGSPVYVGKTNKKIKVFLEENTDKLATKNLALFVCCMIPGDAEKYIQDGFPKKIYDSAKYRTNFGGKLQPDKLNFFERKLTEIVSKKVDIQPEMLYQNMDKLIEFIDSYQ